MAKNQIIEYDSTNANNTDVGGIAIQGVSAVQNFDNGLREVMTHLKDAVTKRVVKSANYTALKTDYAQLIEFDGAYTLALTAAATLTDGWMCYVRANGGDVTIDPDGSETINGASTLSVPDGSFTIVFCNGTAFFTSGNISDVTVSAFGASLIDDADAATARTTLGIPFGPASASTAAYLDFAEDTDNGTNRIRLIGPAAVTSDVDLTLPDGTGTVARTTDFLGQQTMWIPAAAMTPATTNGAEAGTTELATNDVMLSYLAFDPSTTEFAQFSIQMPKGWNEDTLIAQFIWTHPATTTNFVVVWGIRAVAFANDDAMDTLRGTTAYTVDTGGTTSDCYISDETSAMTVAGSPGAEEFVVFEIFREPANVNDTMAVDAYLLGVKIHYTIDAAKDD